MNTPEYTSSEYTSSEYAAVYYLWLTDPRSTFRETARMMTDALAEAGYESVGDGLTGLQLEFPEYPQDEQQFTALDVGRRWLQANLPALVAEPDEVWAEKMVQNQRMMAKSWRRK